MLALVQFGFMVVGVSVTKGYFSRVLARIAEDIQACQTSLKDKQPIDTSCKLYDSPYALKLEQVQKLQGEMIVLKREAEQYNNTDSFVKYSKIQRQLLKMSKTLESELLILSELKSQDKSSITPAEDTTSSVKSEIDCLRANESAIKRNQKNFNFILPLIFTITFSFFPIELNINLSSSMWPLSYLIGVQLNSSTLILSNLLWVLISLRVISIVSHFIPNSSYQIESHKKQQ